MKYAVLRTIPVMSWNAAGTILSFCKVRKISKLGLFLIAKAIRKNLAAESSQGLCSGLNFRSLFYILSIHLGILILFKNGVWYFNSLLCYLPYLKIKKRGSYQRRQFTAVLVRFSFLFQFKLIYLTVITHSDCASVLSK